MSQNPHFRPTRWSLILQARSSDEPTAREALQQLCEAYWYPLYAVVRQRGMSPEDAADSIQSFFAHIIENAVFTRAERSKGKLRSWLLGALQQHLADETRQRTATKRGGSWARVPWHLAEPRYQAEHITNETPETLYHRQWALTILEQAMQQMEAKAAADGTEAEFSLLKPALTTPTAEAIDTAEVAQRLDIPRPHVKVKVHRLRQALRQTVLEIVMETLHIRSTVAAERELRELLVVF
jgi:RNA polymerase sigma-70 factor (ECF subfamily)